ncbi:MAG: hypothetical protein ACODAD_06455, partial [Planctomycetota bacterium]
GPRELVSWVKQMASYPRPIPTRPGPRELVSWVKQMVSYRASHPNPLRPPRARLVGEADGQLTAWTSDRTECAMNPCFCEAGRVRMGKMVIESEEFGAAADAAPGEPGTPPNRGCHLCVAGTPVGPPLPEGKVWRRE